MSEPRSYYILTGPTAGGKSAWLLQRAETVPLAIISADSRQIYRHMDIGTGKSTPAERLKVPHFGLNLLEPSDKFSVYQYYYYSVGCLTQLESFEGEIWFCGGTGLYLRAVLDNLPLGAPPRPELRPGIEASLAKHGSRGLARSLGLAVTDPDNPVRVVRAIERWYASADYQPEQAQQLGLPDQVAMNPEEVELANQRAVNAAEVLRSWRCADLIVLDPGKVVLQQSIERRVRLMFQTGLLDEARELLELGFGETEVVKNGIGYREALAVVQGAMPQDLAIEQTIVRTRQYAKRQRTYFRGRGWLERSPEELA